MLDRIKTLLGQDWIATQDMIRSSLKSDIELLDATNSALEAYLVTARSPCLFRRSRV